MSSGMVRYTIIGGGIQGTAIAIALIQQFGVGAVRIVDRHAEPLTEWDRNCSICGVRVLRSPGSHSLSSDVRALLGYAKHTESRHRLHGRYLHPDYQLFMAHARELIAHYGVQRCWHRDTAERIVLHENGVEIVGTGGTVWSEYVICALGKRYRAPTVEWQNKVNLDVAGGSKTGVDVTGVQSAADAARATVMGISETTGVGTTDTADESAAQTAADVARNTNKATHQAVLYLYDNGDAEHYRAKIERLTAARRPLIVGGGISAIQLSLSLVERAINTTRTGESATDAVIATVMARRPLATHQFDSSPCFLGPDCLQPYSKLPSIAEKLAYSKQYRYAGSIPSVLRQQLDKEIENGTVLFIQDEIASISHGSSGGTVHITTTQQQSVDTDLLVLATGAVGTPLDTPLLHRLVDDYGLPHSAGFPHLDTSLRWHPRVYVTGYAAQSVLGLAAGNIFGAQLALRLLMPSLRGQYSDISRLWQKNITVPTTAKQNPI